MILKPVDDKTNQLKTLEKLLKDSESEAQKELIKKDYQKIKNGYEAEKENAYLIDFYLKDSKNIIVLHDIRLVHDGLTAQIDHLLIGRLEMVIIESKSFKGILEIKQDNSLQVSYSNNIITYPNPLEQAKRHAEVVKKILQANNFLNNTFDIGYELISQVIINPKTTIKNDVLPDFFSKADVFIPGWKTKDDNISLFKAVKMLIGMKNQNKILEIANFILSQHKPIEFDYTKKYKIAKKVESIENTNTIEIKEGTNKEIAKNTDCTQNVNDKIISELKQYRYKTSIKKKLKPYMIFSDKTLNDLVEINPKSLKEIESIKGFGPTKTTEYGEDILKILNTKKE